MEARPVTAVMDEVDFAHTKGAEHNRILKARKIARWLWDRDLGFSNVLAADEKRRREWARQALVTPPSTMETWRAVNDALVAMEQFAEDHPEHPSVARPHADEREKWLGDLAEHEPLHGDGQNRPETGTDAPEEPLATVHQLPERAPEPGITPDGQIPSETASILPRGWAERVALGPIPRFDAKCRRCGAAAVAHTRVNDSEEWRCADHPPQPGEWGASLNWTPRGPVCLCAPNRCYCGRGTHFKLGGTGFRLSDSALLDERAAAKGKNRSPVHVRQAAIAAEEARKATRK